MYRRDIWFCNSKNMYKQNTFWVIFFRSSGPLEPRHHPTYYSRKPMNYWFSIETHKHVYTNETFYSMYERYGSNVHYMWKIVNFWWFLMIFGTFGAQIGPHILLQTPYEWLFYLWDTQSCMYQWEIWFNVWVIWL